MNLNIRIYWNNILGHVGFRWVSDEACRRSSMGLQSDMSVSDGSPIRHIGPLSGMSVSDGSPMADGSPTSFRRVSDRNNIFVNSLISKVNWDKMQPCTVTSPDFRNPRLRFHSCTLPSYCQQCRSTAEYIDHRILCSTVQ